MNDTRLLELEGQLRLLQQEVLHLHRHAAEQCHPRGTSRWRTLCILGLAAILAGIGLLAATRIEAQAPAAKVHTVQAPFHVVDKAGKVVLAVEGGGDFPLQVNDQAGKMIFAVTEGGHRGISLFNTAQGIMVLAGESTKGNGMVETRGSDKENVSILGGTGGLAIWKGDLVFLDAPAKKRTELGHKGMKVYDKSEQPILRLAADPTSQFGTLVLGKSGKTLIELVAEKDAGSVSVKGPDGKALVELGEKGVRVYGKQGKPIARIGPNSTGDSGFVGVGQGGKILAELVALKDVGALALRGMDEQGVVELGHMGVQVVNKGKVVGHLGFAPSGSGAGYLAIGNPKGDTIVEGGMLPDSRGIVRAYPFKPRTGDILVGQNLIIGAKQ